VRFSAEAVEQLREACLALRDKRVKLLSGFSKREFSNARAREYVWNGFLRRVNTLVRCIENVFEGLPPDLVEPPPTELLSDAIINIQAFVFNAFGSIDNLAWIWVSEKRLTQENGSPIPDMWVGLGKRNKFVRCSFSQEFQTYLSNLDNWFDNLENFRHALAHRIPLYVAPFVILQANEASYRDLEDRKNQAIASRDFAGYDRLSAEQTALGVFWPSMTHSFEEKAHHVAFHAQMLADFNTIEEIGLKILEELGG
jgi:hypothetical protein